MVVVMCVRLSGSAPSSFESVSHYVARRCVEGSGNGRLVLPGGAACVCVCACPCVPRRFRSSFSVDA